MNNNNEIVSFEELWRSRRVLSASAGNALLDLHNSSYNTKPHSLIVKYNIIIIDYCIYKRGVFCLMSIHILIIMFMIPFPFSS